MGSGSAITTTIIAVASTIFFTILFIGLGLAVVLSLIPTYTTTKSATISGEKYCINNYRLNVTLSGSTSPGTALANSTYILSLACTRILQSYITDNTFSSCLISNCNLTDNTVAGSSVSTNTSCSVVVYYSTRCTDQAPTSGINNTVYSSNNSACRQQRLSAINYALGASSTQFTNVPNIVVGGNTYPVISVFDRVFSSYGQNGSYYCGAISQSGIASAVYNQASG